MATYEESLARQRARLHERIDLYQRMQALGSISVAKMAEVLNEAAEEMRVLDELEAPIERDSA